jgi:hypothetical protein
MRIKLKADVEEIVEAIKTLNPKVKGISYTDKEIDVITDVPLTSTEKANIISAVESLSKAREAM